MKAHQVHGLFDHAKAHISLAVDVSAGLIQHAGVSARGADFSHKGIVAVHPGQPLPHGGKVILVCGLFKADGVFREEVAKGRGQAVGAPGELIGVPLLAKAAEQFDARALQRFGHAVKEHQMGRILLDGHDLVASKLNELLHLGWLDPGAGERGVVVDHHADVQFIGKQLVVFQHAVHSGNEVVGQNHLYAVGADGLGIPADLNGALRAGAAGPGDDGNRPVNLLHADADDFLLLIVRQVGKFAIGTAGGNRAFTGVFLDFAHQEPDVLPVAVVVDLAVFVEGGHGHKSNSVHICSQFFSGHHFDPFLSAFYFKCNVSL